MHPARERTLNRRVAVSPARPSPGQVQGPPLDLDLDRPSPRSPLLRENRTSLNRTSSPHFDTDRLPAILRSTDK